MYYRDGQYREGSLLANLRDEENTTIVSTMIITLPTERKASHAPNNTKRGPAVTKQATK